MARRKPKPSHTFNIRPERGSRLSVCVEVFASCGQFRTLVRAEAKEEGLRARTRGLVGQCLGVTERCRKSKRKTPRFAVLRFPRQHLTMATITHEAFHATMRWAHRRGFDAVPAKPDVSNITGFVKNASLEERAATVHDNLCRRIVIELQRRDLLPA